MQEGLKERVMRILTVCVLALIIFGGIAAVYPNQRRCASLRRENAELQERIENKKREIATLQENQRRFRTDADFVEAIARQNHRVFPGELIFIFEKD